MQSSQPCFGRDTFSALHAFDTSSRVGKLRLCGFSSGPLYFCNSFQNNSCEFIFQGLAEFSSDSIYWEIFLSFSPSSSSFSSFFLTWETFYYCFSLIACYITIQVVLYSPGFILVDHMYLEIYPFLPDFPIDWKLSAMANWTLTWLDLEAAKRHSWVGGGLWGNFLEGLFWGRGGFFRVGGAFWCLPAFSPFCESTCPGAATVASALRCHQN